MRKTWSFLSVEVKQKKHLLITASTFIDLSFQKGKNNVSFNYVAKPKQAMYFVGSEEKIICKFGRKDKENTPVVGFRVLMM
jgi:hypothetical protein